MSFFSRMKSGSSVSVSFLHTMDLRLAVRRAYAVRNAGVMGASM